MKVAVIGSRTFGDYAMIKDYLDRLNAMREISRIISGGAAGADMLGERWAEENKVEKLVFEAKWDDLTHSDALIKVNSRGKQYDARAGFRRNKDIIEAADVVIAFWDGSSRGTKDGIDHAGKIGKPIKIIRF